jgi:hypothetical protein
MFTPGEIASFTAPRGWVHGCVRRIGQTDRSVVGHAAIPAVDYSPRFRGSQGVDAGRRHGPGIRAGAGARESVDNASMAAIKATHAAPIYLLGNDNNRFGIYDTFVDVV